MPSRYIRPLPPSMLRVEFCEIAREMSLDDLLLALQVFELELQQRQGLSKYQLPAQTAPTLN